MGWWLVRSGIQVDVELNLRQRCVVKAQQQAGWRQEIMENLLKTKLVKQQTHPSFVYIQKNVSFSLESLLNLRNLAHFIHFSFTFSHFKIPHEIETTTSPYGFSKVWLSVSPLFCDAKNQPRRTTSWPRCIKQFLVWLMLGFPFSPSVFMPIYVMLSVTHLLY